MNINIIGNDISNIHIDNSINIFFSWLEYILSIIILLNDSI